MSTHQTKPSKLSSSGNGNNALGNDEWEDLGTSSRILVPGGNGNESMTMSTSNIQLVPTHEHELERLLMEAQREGSSRATSLRDSSGPHSPVWSTSGGTGFSSPVFLHGSANQIKLETALANYSSRPEGTPLKPHELAEKFRHPNGNSGGAGDRIEGLGAGGVTLSGDTHSVGISSYPHLSISDEDTDLDSIEGPLGYSYSNSRRRQVPGFGWMPSSVWGLFQPPYSYVLIPTHLIMFGLGAMLAYVYFAKRYFKRYI